MGGEGSVLDDSMTTSQLSQSQRTTSVRNETQNGSRQATAVTSKGQEQKYKSSTKSAREYLSERDGQNSSRKLTKLIMRSEETNGQKLRETI